MLRHCARPNYRLCPLPPTVHPTKSRATTSGRPIEGRSCGRSTAGLSCAHFVGALFLGSKKTVKEWKVLTTNARSETIETIASYKSAFAERRCLIPVSAFYEWTGEKKGQKTKWAFTLPGSGWFCFAGIWDRACRDGPRDLVGRFVSSHHDLDGTVTRSRGPFTMPTRRRYPLS